MIIDGVEKSKFFATERDAKAFLRDSKSKEALTAKGCPSFSVFSVVYLNQKKREVKAGKYETIEGAINLIKGRWGDKLLNTIDNGALQRLIIILRTRDTQKHSLESQKRRNIYVANGSL